MGPLRSLALTLAILAASCACGDHLEAIQRAKTPQAQHDAFLDLRRAGHRYTVTCYDELGRGFRPDRWTDRRTHSIRISCSGGGASVTVPLLAPDNAAVLFSEP